MAALQERQHHEIASLKELLRQAELNTKSQQKRIEELEESYRDLSQTAKEAEKEKLALLESLEEMKDRFHGDENNTGTIMAQEVEKLMDELDKMDKLNSQYKDEKLALQELLRERDQDLLELKEKHKELMGTTEMIEAAAVDQLQATPSHQEKFQFQRKEDNVDLDNLQKDDVICRLQAEILDLERKLEVAQKQNNESSGNNLNTIDEPGVNDNNNGNLSFPLKFYTSLFKFFQFFFLNLGGGVPSYSSPQTSVSSSRLLILFLIVLIYG